MKTKTVKLDDTTRDVLMRSRIEGNNLYLPGQLPRDDYQRVAKAIEAAGGKWNRKAGCHVFPADVRETLNIGAESVDVVNVQQTFQAFYTPKELAAQVIAMANIDPQAHRILEPSAGTGNLLSALHESVPLHLWTFLDIVAVEINQKLSKGLNEFTDDVRCEDFLTCKVEDLGKFDRIIMNPPFTNGTDIKHIQHALTFLKSGSRLVAICCNGPRQNEVIRPLANEWQEIPAGAFKSSGTGISTALLSITT